MYQCKDCAEVFSEPYIHKWEESHFGIGGFTETMFSEQCPNCYSDEIESLSRCECCLDGWVEIYHEGTFVENRYVDLCVECQEKGRELYMYAKNRFPDLNVEDLFTGNVYELMKFKGVAK